MRRSLILLLLLACVFVHWCNRLPNVIKRVRSSVVFVEAWGEFGQRRSGSGVILSDGLIMTAQHVTVDANDVRVTFDDGTRIRSSKFFELNTDSVDVGLIIVEGMDNHLHFAQFEPRPGTKVFTVGSPYALQNSVTVGVFSGGVYIGDERLHQLDINSAPGMSGCPVFNCYGGVIGILVRGNYSGMAFIVPADVCEFVVAVYENVQKAKAN